MCDQIQMEKYVSSVQHAPRRIAAHLRALVDELLQQMKIMNVNEQATEPQQDSWEREISDADNRRYSATLGKGTDLQVTKP